MAVKIYSDSFELGTEGPGCLLIHGFTGSPQEMKPLGQFLAVQGFHVYGVRLAGHGTTVSDLMKVRWQEWRRTAADALKTWQTRHQVVHVVGLSLGALIAMDLGADLARGKIVALAAPYRLVQWWAFLAHYARFFLPSISINSEPWFADQMFSYQEFPLASVHELLVYRNWVIRKRASLVKRPVLMVQGGQDKTVAPISAWLWAQRIGSPQKQIVLLERSGHILPLDVDRQTVFSLCAQFLEDQE